MVKKILASTLISAVVIGFSGCGEAPKPVIKQLTRVEPIVVEFPKVDPVTMKEINFNNVRFTDQIQRFSKFKKYRHIRNFESIADYTGLKVSKQNDMYVLNYSKETKGRKDGRTVVKTEAIFHIQAIHKANVYTFKYPTTYTYIEGSNFGMTEEPLSKLSNLEEDSKNIFSKLKTIFISKSFTLNEEINSKYPAKSIYANFKRILGNYTYRNNEHISESKKQNTFNINVNGRYLPLYVEVFPYREGSKVKYSTTLSYKITQSGSDLTKQDIENIKTKIAKIVND